jgi:dTDP-4-amino-4,6-dideoxygalactose transaminase
VIPFLDLKEQYRSIKNEVDEAALRVLGSGRYVLGPEVERFEESFAKYCLARCAVGVNSGTSALHLALLAAGIGPGDEVVTVPMTFVATAAAIEYAGAKPVFVDIDPVQWTMDPAKVEAALTSRTKAVIPVHLHGLMADMDPIVEIAKAHNLVVIEDAAQAHGAEYRGRRAGSIGDMGCFSFYPGKNLGACGEGGAVVTDDPELEKKLRQLRDWGQEGKCNHVVKGYNYRMDALQGALLDVKLKHLERWTESRRRHAASYDRFFSGVKVKRPQEPPHARHVYHVYSILTDSRDELQKLLLESGIQTGVHYPVPVHLLPSYRNLGCAKGDFPVAERAAGGFLSLPMFPELKESQLKEFEVVFGRAYDAVI